MQRIGWLVAAALCAGCGNGGTVDAGDGAVDAVDAAPVDAAPSPFRVRLANFVDAGAVDFCIAPEQDGQPGTFEGPALATRATPAGLAYGQVSQYVPTAPGAPAYYVRLVAPGATDCATPLAGREALRVDMVGASDAYATVVYYGSEPGAGQPAQTFVLADQRMSITGVMTMRLRFANAIAATSAALDLGRVEGQVFEPIFQNVAPGRIAVGRGIDRFGFAQIPPAEGVTIALRRAGAGDLVLSTTGVALRDGAIVSAFAFGALDEPARPLRLALCEDLMQAETLTRCALYP